MRRRPGRLRAWKWRLTIASGVLLLILVANCWLSVSYTRPTWSVEIDWWAVTYASTPAERPFKTSGFEVRNAFQLDIDLDLNLFFWKPPPPRKIYSMPLIPPLLVLIIPTAYLWWRDRRRIPPGHCQKCGYDLTGNVSGVCPECGSKVKREGETS